MDAFTYHKTNHGEILELRARCILYFDRLGQGQVGIETTDGEYAPVYVRIEDFAMAVRIASHFQPEKT